MSSHNPPLTYKDVVRGLKAMGFSQHSQKGSHEQWRKTDGNTRKKVTVDKPNAPFTQMLIESMASQAGVNKKIFYEYCLNKNKRKEAKRQISN